MSFKIRTDASGNGQFTIDSTDVLSINTNTTVSLPTGTANGVAYLNGSKVLTSGSALTFDGANLGLGVTPSAWATLKALQVSTTASLAGFPSTEYAAYSSNAYYNAGWKYITSAPASQVNLSAGGVQFQVAASGTAGNAITFTQAMTLNSSGNLTISGSTATKASGTTWANPSDQRLKDNIRDYEKGLVELMQVMVREWEYNGKGGTTEGLKGLGVVADEIEKILPNTVETYEAKLEETDEEVTTIKKFDATEITWLLVNAVKELTQRIEALEAKGEQ